MRTSILVALLLGSCTDGEDGTKPDDLIADLGDADADADSDSDSDSDTDTDTTGSTAETGAPVCPDHILAAVPATVVGNTVGGADLHGAGGCGGAGAPDVTVALTAPTDGTYVISTAGSAFDTSLTVHEGCEGKPGECVDAAFPEAEALELTLVAGEIVSVTLDGVAGAAGDYQIAVFEGGTAIPEGHCGDGYDNDLDGTLDCDDADCAADPVCLPACADTAYLGGLLQLDTRGLLDDEAPSCGAVGTEDVVVAYTAPATGRYWFETVYESDFTLAVLDGCGGVELGCGTDAVEVDLATGQQVVAVLQGTDPTVNGRVDLRIYPAEAPEVSCADGGDNDDDGDMDCLDTDCSADPVCMPVCPSHTLAAVPSEVSGDNTGYPDTASGSCNFFGLDGSDDTVEFTAPFDGTFGFVLDPSPHGVRRQPGVAGGLRGPRGGVRRRVRRQRRRSADRRPDSGVSR